MGTNNHVKQSHQVIPYSEQAKLLERLKRKMGQSKTHLPKVAVLLCGGTIWMDSNYEIRVDDAQRILKPLRLKGLDEVVDAQVVPVFPTPFDSTNARWTHWATIGHAIRGLYDDFDGFVVCFGTDTMAHLMAALHFILPNAGKPIIGVGSQVPMAQLGEDATRNLYFAIMAASSNLRGAHLAFDDKVMHGLHLWKTKGKSFDAFDCPQRFILGEFTGKGVELYDRVPARNPSINTATLSFDPDFREGVKVVHVSPGTPAESLLHDAKDPLIHAILLIGLGVGNVRDTPLYRGEMTYVDAIRQLHKQRFPVVIGNAMIDEPASSPYPAGKNVLSRHVGGIPGGGATEVTLEVKIMHCLGKAWQPPHRCQGKHTEHLHYLTFIKLMCDDHVGELSKRGW